MCSAVIPEYSTGMSQPANGTIRAPSATCRAWRAVFLIVEASSSAIEGAGRMPASVADKDGILSNLLRLVTSHAFSCVFVQDFARTRSSSSCLICAHLHNGSDHREGTGNELPRSHHAHRRRERQRAEQPADDAEEDGAMKDEAWPPACETAHYDVEGGDHGDEHRREHECAEIDGDAIPKNKVEV